MAGCDRKACNLPGLLGAVAILGLAATWPLHAQTPIQQSGPPDILGKPSGATQASPSAARSTQTGAAVSRQPAPVPAPVSAAPSTDGAPDRTRIAISEELKLDQQKASTPQKVKGRFADVVRVADPRLRDQVNVEGTVRFEQIAGDAGKRAIITWNQVVRTDQKDKKKTFSSPLVSSFKPLQSSVTPGVSLTAQGDVNAAIAAAQALFADAEEKKEEAKPTTNTQQPQQQQSRTGGGAGNAMPKNDMLRSIQVPDGSGITVTPPQEDVVGTTSEGCPMNIDLVQGVAIVTSRITKNGTPEGECSDTATRFPIQKSYVGCEDVVDKPNMVAHPQYRNYFMREDGTTNFIGDACQPDMETGFALTEDPSNCTYETNIAELKAYRRSELVYSNKAGQRVVVEACRRTPEATPVDMARTIEGCAIRHDFAAGSSVQQKKTVFTDPQGAMFQVSGCADSEEAADRYLHQRDFSACTAQVSLATMQAIPQFRLFIQPPGGKTYISECTPDPEAAVVVQETVEGCETVFFHDLPAGQSYGASRFRYQNGDEFVWVNASCQKSQATYPHQLETQGYEHHDDQRFSYPKQAIYINAPGGRADVSPAMVRAGAPQLPYSLVSAATIPDPNNPPTYEGCNRFSKTLEVETYTRADNSTYDYVLGPGPTAGPIDVCVNELTGTVTKITHKRWILSDGQNCQVINTTFQVLQKKNTETGQLVGAKFCGSQTGQYQGFAPNPSICYNLPGVPEGNPWFGHSYTCP